MLMRGMHVQEPPFHARKINSENNYYVLHPAPLATGLVSFLIPFSLHRHLYHVPHDLLCLCFYLLTECAAIRYSMNTNTCQLMLRESHSPTRCDLLNPNVSNPFTDYYVCSIMCVLISPLGSAFNRESLSIC